jgi:hypothetical protein
MEDSVHLGLSRFMLYCASKERRPLYGGLKVFQSC